MSEPAARVFLVAIAVGVALTAAFLARGRERRRARQAPLDLTGMDGRILFFTSATCSRCDAVRTLLDRLGLEYREVSHGESPDIHRRLGVTGVPLLVLRDAVGAETSRFAGRVSRRRLLRALRASD